MAKIRTTKSTRFKIGAKAWQSSPATRCVSTSTNSIFSHASENSITRPQLIQSRPPQSYLDLDLFFFLPANWSATSRSLSLTAGVSVWFVQMSGSEGNTEGDVRRLMDPPPYEPPTGEDPPFAEAERPEREPGQLAPSAPLPPSAPPAPPPSAPSPSAPSPSALTARGGRSAPDAVAGETRCGARADSLGHTPACATAAGATPSGVSVGALIVVSVAIVVYGIWFRGTTETAPFVVGQRLLAELGGSEGVTITRSRGQNQNDPISNTYYRVEFRDVQKDERKRFEYQGLTFIASGASDGLEPNGSSGYYRWRLGEGDSECTRIRCTHPTKSIVAVELDIRPKPSAGHSDIAFGLQVEIQDENSKHFIRKAARFEKDGPVLIRAANHHRLHEIKIWSNRCDRAYITDAVVYFAPGEQ